MVAVEWRRRWRGAVPEGEIQGDFELGAMHAGLSVCQVAAWIWLVGVVTCLVPGLYLGGAAEFILVLVFGMFCVVAGLGALVGLAHCLSAPARAGGRYVAASAASLVLGTLVFLDYQNRSIELVRYFLVVGLIMFHLFMFRIASLTHSPRLALMIIWQMLVLLMVLASTSAAATLAGLAWLTLSTPFVLRALNR